MRRYISWELPRRSCNSHLECLLIHIQLTMITLFWENDFWKTYLFFMQIILGGCITPSCSSWNLEVAYVFNRFALFSKSVWSFARMLTNLWWRINLNYFPTFLNRLIIFIPSFLHRCTWIKCSRFKHVSRNHLKIKRRLYRRSYRHYWLPCDCKLGNNLSVFRKHRYYTKTIFVINLFIHPLPSARL